jgi:pyruvate/2-oxoacid:ferredoxin oxidoreductase beta subunit
MANPNIVNVTTIYGETAVLAATTANANVVQNAAASNQIYKINSLFASNLNDASDMDVTVDIVRSGTNYSLARNITVPFNATVVVIAKDSTLYLQEGDALSCAASSNSNVQIVCSYEVIA